MRFFVLLLVATCAVVSVKADKQWQQQRSSQEPSEGFSQDQQQEMPEVPSQEPFQGPFQGPPQGIQKGDQNGPRPGHQGPRPGPPGPRPGPHGPRPEPLGPPPSLFKDFTNKQLNEIVNRILKDAHRFREKMGNKGMGCIEHIREMFVNYNSTLELVEAKSSSCVTDDMKALPEKAITEIRSCLPSQTDFENKKKESEAAFDALVKTLKTADDEISALTDDAQKQIKIAEIEWSDVYQFYVTKADNMFSAVQNLNSCMSTERSEIQTEVTKYLEELKTCSK